MKPMKTILVPIDFSDASKNALEYAIQFSTITDSQITLFHVYYTPPVTIELPIVVPSLEELEKNCMNNLNTLKNNIVSKSEKHLSINCVCKCGFPVDRIIEYAERNKTDLIIMGMQGTGWLREKLIGSTT